MALPVYLYCSTGGLVLLDGVTGGLVLVETVTQGLVLKKPASVELLCDMGAADDVKS